MNEFLDTVQFDADNRAGIEELLAFEARHGSKLAIDGNGELIIRLGDEDLRCPLAVRRLRQGLTLSVEGLPSSDGDVDGDVAQRLEPLEGEQPMAEWLEAFGKLPASAGSFTLHVQYEKRNNPADGLYEAFSQKGFEEIRLHVRKQLPAIVPEGITIATPLVASAVHGQGIAVVPLASTVRAQPSKHLLTPSLPAPMDSWLARLQADIVGLVHLGKDLGPDPGFDAGALRELAVWLQSHEIRALLGRRRIAEVEIPHTTKELRKFAKSLAMLEGELVGGALKTFEGAQTAFREISIDLLRNLHSMRGEILSLVGSELFQTSVSIALTIAGLTVANIADIPQTIAVSLIVASLFFIGALLKTVTYALEFRRLIEFNRNFEKLPVASAMPEFRDWYVKTVDSSIQSFYASIAIGLPIAGIPLYGVLALWVATTWPEGPSVGPLFACELLVVSVLALVFWFFGPRRRLLGRPGA